MKPTLLLCLCACTGSPEITDATDIVDPVPNRYPRCEPAEDEPIIPQALDLLKWPERIATLKASAQAAAEELPNEVPRPIAPSAEALLDTVRSLQAKGDRTTGSEGARHALDVVLSRAEAAGAEVDRRQRTVPGWSGEATLTIDGASHPVEPVIYTGMSAPAEGHLLYVGEGSTSTLESMDIAGRVLVAELTYTLDVPDLDNPILYGWSDPDDQLSDHPGSRIPGLRGNFPGRFYRGQVPTDAIADDIVQNAIDGGAAGLLLLLRDHAADDAVPIGPYDGERKDLSVGMIDRAHSDAVRVAAKAELPASLTVAATHSDLEVTDGWAVLPGATEHILLLTTHVDAPFGGVSEDGLAVAQVIGQLEAWSTLPVADRPYTLVALFNDAHFAGARGTQVFLRDMPHITQRTQVVLTVDGLGSDEAVWNEANGEFERTGLPERSSLMVGHELPLLTAVLAATRAAPPPSTRIWSTAVYLPASEAGGAVVQTSGARPDRTLRVDCGVPFVSWGAAPPWHLDRHDTLSKVHPTAAGKYADTLTEIVARLMLTDPWVKER